MQKYTLRVAHLELGGVNLDFAVEDDVLPFAEYTHEGDLVGETQSIVAAPPQGDLASVGFKVPLLLGPLNPSLSSGKAGQWRHEAAENRWLIQPVWPVAVPRPPPLFLFNDHDAVEVVVVTP